MTSRTLVLVGIGVATRRLAQMYTRFSAIAADNHSAWNRKRVEGKGCHGLLSSVSGVLTKQGFGLWSREKERKTVPIAVVQSEDRSLIARMESSELCGASVTLRENHSFTL